MNLWVSKSFQVKLFNCNVLISVDLSHESDGDDSQEDDDEEDDDDDIGGSIVSREELVERQVESETEELEDGERATKKARAEGQNSSGDKWCSCQVCLMLQKYGSYDLKFVLVLIFSYLM